MHSILVRINGLKYNFGKQKSIWLVKVFRYSRFKLLDFYRMKNVACLLEKEFLRGKGSIRHWNYPNLSLLLDTNISSMVVASPFS